MTTAEKLKLCQGCHYDYTNHRGAEAGPCWHLGTAQPVKRTLIGTWQPPPYNWEPVTTLSCHMPDGMHWIDRNDVRIREAKP